MIKHCLWFFLGCIVCCVQAAEKPQVFDCFLYLNEAEILNMRIQELNPWVDYFVLVESEETFKGHPKPLHFEEIKSRFTQFTEKIIHIIVKGHYDTTNNWERERFQRNQILYALEACGHCKVDDIVILSDVDEIVRGELIPIAIARLQAGKEAISCNQTMYRFFLNRFDPYPWVGSVLTTYRTLASYTPEEIRRNRTNFNLHHDGLWESLKNGGWHFTCMGGVSSVTEKILSFSHTPEEGSNPPASSDELCRWASWYQLVPIDDTFPLYVQQHQQELISLGLLDQ